MERRAGNLLIVAVVAGLAGGCALQAPPPSPSVHATPTEPSNVAPSRQPSTTSPSVGPGPSGQAGGDIDPATFLQVCAGLPDTVDDEPIWCDDLVRTALEASPGELPVSRVDTAYTCATSCRPPDADRGFAIVRSASGAVEVEVARQPDGSFAVVATTPFEPAPAPPFVSPPVSAPPIEDAPASINDRSPLPLCGVEDGSAYGPFETEARQCFWDGVRAGGPVEFITIHPDTEGLRTTTIYRYAGTGGVEVIANDEGGWSRMFTGVGPAQEEGRVFDLAGLTRRQPIPTE